MAGFMEPAKLAIFFLIISSVLAIGLNMEDETSFPFLLPKVELHAHLHGSIRQSTLIEFARSANDSGTSFTCRIYPMKNAHLTKFYNNSNYVGSSSFLLEGERDLNKCFGIFQAIHSMIRSKETVLKVLLEVLEDFMSENVIYLELRSTPRNLEGKSFNIRFSSFILITWLIFQPSIFPDGTTKLEYIDLLVSTIEMHNELYGDRMLVRLLISIDRSKSLEENEETVELALGVRTRSKVIVGIDLSGNPLKGNFVSFLPILKKCSESGLFITIHTAEIPDKESVRNEIKDIADESANDFSGSTFESEREEILSPLLTETDQILFFW